MKKLIFFLLLIPFVCYGQPMKVIGRSGFYTPPPVSPYCSEYEAVYNAFDSKPHADTALIQNVLVSTLVDSGYWERMDVFYVFAAHEEDDESWVNWINPGTFTADRVNDPAFVRWEGYTSTGEAEHIISTNYTGIDSINTTQNSLTGGIYLRTHATGASVFGYSGDHDFYLSPSTTNTVVRINDNADMLSTPPDDTKGLWLVTRRGATDIEVYLNGSSRDAESDASDGMFEGEIHVCGREGSAITSTAQIAIFFVMDGITDDEATEINTIIETYMDAIGKGVQ